MADKSISLASGTLLGSLNSKLHFRSLTEAKSWQPGRHSLQVENDDWPLEELRWEYWITRMLRAFTAQWKAPPTDMPEAERAEWNAWQTVHFQDNQRILHDRAQFAERMVWSYFLLVLEMHKMGAQEGFEIHQGLKCSDRLEQSIMCAAAYPAVGNRLLTGIAQGEMAHSPQAFTQRLINLRFTNVPGQEDPRPTFTAINKPDEGGEGK